MRLFVLAAIFASGCSAAATVGTFGVTPRDPSVPVHIFVMPPVVEGSPATGNVGRNFSEVEQAVAMRLLTIVRERDAGAMMAEPTDQTFFQPMAKYIDAVAPARTTKRELEAAGFALQHGGTHLLVPTIIEWREVRTGDPIGALLPPHGGVVIALRLVRLEPVMIVGSVTFKNHFRVTVNQSADKLLNGDFRKTVRRLIASSGVVRATSSMRPSRGTPLGPRPPLRPRQTPTNG